MSGRQFFTESEKTCLQELIIKYKLNSKATNGVGNPAVKKITWARLVADYNSIETNTRRTEAQLKKCWDNMKTRRKQALAIEKKERMKTGGGPYCPQPSTSATASQETLDDALLEGTDVELQFAMDSDNVANVDRENVEENILLEEIVEEHVTEEEAQVVAESTVQPAIVQSGRSGPLLSEGSQSTVGSQADLQGGYLGRPRTTGRQSRTSDYDRTPSQASGARNIRSQVISEEFSLRQENYKRQKEREEELHKLKIKEKEWQIKTAEQQYHTACLERQSAEELLRCNRAKREAAEAANLI